MRWKIHVIQKTEALLSLWMVMVCSPVGERIRKKLLFFILF